MATEAVVMNEALRYMDPTTRGQYMRQMQRDYPGLIGRGGAEGTAFREVGTPAPPTGGVAAQQYGEQMLTSDRLAQAIAGLSAAKVGLARTGKRKSLGKDFGVPMEFLGDYLRSAQQAYGAGVGRQTRAQRAYSEQRLQELSGQAEQDPRLAAMAKLGGAIVNPAMTRAPASGGLGTRGATSAAPGGDVRRGVSRRNVALT